MKRRRLKLVGWRIRPANNVENVVTVVFTTNKYAKPTPKKRHTNQDATDRVIKFGGAKKPLWSVKLRAILNSPAGSRL